MEKYVPNERKDRTLKKEINKTELNNLLERVQSNGHNNAN